MSFFQGLSTVEILSAFIVLFAIIDILGSVPIIMQLKEKGLEVNARNATLISLVVLVIFFYAGDLILRLFNVDINSFAVAGSFVIFLIALEMTLDIEIFKNMGPTKSGTLVPLVFPLIAGAGAFTTLLSLRAQYADINILIAVVLNMVWVYLVITLTDRIRAIIGDGGIYMLRKFFGIILLAVAVSLFSENISVLFK